MANETDHGDHTADDRRHVTEDLEQGKVGRYQAQFVNGRRRTIELQGVFAVADLLAADRRQDIERGQGRGDVLCRKAPGLQRSKRSAYQPICLPLQDRIGRFANQSLIDGRRGCAFGVDDEHAGMLVQTCLRRVVSVVP